MRLVLLSLSFALAAACATGTSAESSASGSASAVGDCGPMVSAHAQRGTTVFSAPDSNASAVTTLDQSTTLCASKESRGFGFRRVRLADGRTGFIDEQNLN